MPEQPLLVTERLQLRPFAMTDAGQVQALAGERAIADTTLLIPHPYGDGEAEAWIATHAPQFHQGRQAAYAITLRPDGAFIGAITLIIVRKHDRAELGYWIGTPWWSRGYATEAAKAIIGYGFEDLGLHRIEAEHFSRNPASGRVMLKCGMRSEGRQLQAVKKWGAYEDIERYGLIRP
jgi:[ribosomal protein S5]-alanine N-acetyltransferase